MKPFLCILAFLCATVAARAQLRIDQYPDLGGSVDAADWILMWDTSATATKKIGRENLLASRQPLDADLTQIAALADPNADRILLWDDSANAGAGAWLHGTLGSGLDISGTTITATMLANSNWNAKGDLIAATADDVAAILPVGTAGQVLTVDAATPTGLKWAAASGGALTNTYVGYGAGGVLSGEAAFTYNATTNTLSIENIAAVKTPSLSVYGDFGSSTYTMSIGFENAYSANRLMNLNTPDSDGTLGIPAWGDAAITSYANAWGDGIKQTFNPNGTTAGINVGSHAGDPSAPANGDLWYDSAANELTARINGTNVAVGAGGSLTATYIGYGSGGGALTGEGSFTYDAVNNIAYSANFQAEGYYFTDSGADHRYELSILSDPSANRAWNWTLPDSNVFFEVADMGGDPIHLRSKTTTIGAWPTPNTTTPLSVTWPTSDDLVLYQGATGEIDLPPVADYANRELIVIPTGTYAITVDPNASEQIIVNGTSLGAGTADVLTVTAGLSHKYFSDGYRWVRNSWHDSFPGSFSGTGTYLAGGVYSGTVNADVTVTMALTRGQRAEFNVDVTGATRRFTFDDASYRVGYSGGTITYIDLPIGRHRLIFYHDGTNQIVADSVAEDVDLTADVTGTLPVANGGTGITSLGTGVATWWGTPSSANLRSAVTDEVGTGSLMFTRTGVLRTLYVNAGAMIPRTTNGAATATVELATNDIMFDSLDFDQTTEEGVGFWVTFPHDWGAGTVTAKFHWTAASGTGTVKWDIAARGYTDDDALDQALGTEQTASADTLIATNDMHVSGTTPAITVGGSVAAGRPVYFQVTRDVGGDDLTGDARLLGVTLQYTESTTEASAQ